MNPPVFISNLIAMHSSEHYSFTEEELDFIINYDIKAPMGLGGEPLTHRQPFRLRKTQSPNSGIM